MVLEYGFTKGVDVVTLWKDSPGCSIKITASDAISDTVSGKVMVGKVMWTLGLNGAPTHIGNQSPLRYNTQLRSMLILQRVSVPHLKHHFSFLWLYQIHLPSCGRLMCVIFRQTNHHSFWSYRNENYFGHLYVMSLGVSSKLIIWDAPLIHCLPLNQRRSRIDGKFGSTEDVAIIFLDNQPQGRAPSVICLYIGEVLVLQVPLHRGLCMPQLRKLWQLCTCAIIIDKSLDQTKVDKLCCHEIVSQILV